MKGKFISWLQKNKEKRLRYFAYKSRILGTKIRSK